jgi:holliday junction DNA helicase RuvA
MIISHANFLDITTGNRIRASYELSLYYTKKSADLQWRKAHFYVNFYLSGLIIDLNQDEKTLLILTQGVGYRVTVTTELLSKSQIDHKTALFIYTAVREDDISLYGFAKKEELEFYRKLLSVSGIGPKSAMEILSAPLSLTQNAIVNGDVAVLTKIKGIGKKTAERMVLELKNKIVPVRPSGTTAPTPPAHEEAVLVLTNLGYERYEVLRALVDLPAEFKETEAIVKYFLREARR